jgi:hypothetical protein
MLSAVWLSTLQFDKLSGGPFEWIKFKLKPCVRVFVGNFPFFFVFYRIQVDKSNHSAERKITTKHTALCCCWQTEADFSGR